MALCERCSAEILRGGDVLPQEWFDSRNCLVLVDGRTRHLPRGMWSMLAILWHRRAADPVSVETFLRLLYSEPADEPEHAEASIRSQVARLRKALVGTPYSLLTLHTRGYRMIEVAAEGNYPHIGPIEPWDGPQPRKNHYHQYPFRWMRVGQSFLVRNGDTGTVRSGCSSPIARACGRFVIRQEATGVRVTMVSEIDRREPTLTMRRPAARIPHRG